MKKWICPVCQKEVQEDRKFCGQCGTPLPVNEARITALQEYLTRTGVIASPEELLQAVPVKVTVTSDDGLMDLDIEEEFRCPLYLNYAQTMDALVRQKIIPGKDFHYIRDFSRSSEGEDRPAACGEAVLAEVLHSKEEKTLVVVYQHRQEMISRAGPMECLYGCPVSSRIEKQYQDTCYRTETISLDE